MTEQLGARLVDDVESPIALCIMHVSTGTRSYVLIQIYPMHNCLKYRFCNHILLIADDDGTDTSVLSYSIQHPASDE